jgi:hypothetical protein
MSTALLRAVGFVALATVFTACDGSQTDPGPGTITSRCLNQKDTNGGACSVTDIDTGVDTGTVTGTNTNTVSNTTTATGTNTDTSSVTATNTNTATTTASDTSTSTAPEWCTNGSYPVKGGSPVDLNNGGTWHTLKGNTEWVFNCTVSTEGNTNCCGTLLAEVSTVNASSRTIWDGYSMEHCFSWFVGTVNSNAPAISATGYQVNSTATRIDLTGANEPTWFVGATHITACEVNK